MTQRTMRAPSKDAAAWYLRRLALTEAGITPETARRLELLADCIEGKVRWARGHAFPFRWRQHLWFRATMVERRPRGETVAQALDMHAAALARQMGLTAPDDPQIVRAHLEAMRKLIRTENQKKDRGSKN